MKELDKVIQEYKKSRVVTTRKRYPKIDLHDKFVKVLELQINKLRKEGLTDDKIVDRIQRAIPFHVYDEGE
jgi:hypothetical protein